MVAPSQIGGGASHLKARVTALQKHKTRELLSPVLVTTKLTTVSLVVLFHATENETNR